MSEYCVRVVPDASGRIVRINQNKPEYGSIEFRQRREQLRRGWVQFKERVTWLAGTIDDLEEFVEFYNLTVDSQLPGKIYTVESFKPFYMDQQPKINPSTGNAVLVDGALVYQQSYYDKTGESEDKYLQGDITVGGKITEPKAVSFHTMGLSM